MAVKKIRISPAFLKAMAAQADLAKANSDSKAADEVSEMAEGSYEETERQRVKTEGLREKNEDRKLNRELRKSYAKSVFCYLVCYSVFVAVILLLSGFNLLCFSLPESVLSFLVGSTAAAAIGLVFAVTNGLFKGIDS